MPCDTVSYHSVWGFFMPFVPTIKQVSADSRGEIYSISLPDNRELMLLHSAAGSMRGGHSHNVPESVMVLTGSMRYRKKSPYGTRIETTFFLQAGDSSPTAAGTDHVADFPKDTWLVEMKHARIGEWTQSNYAPWRAEVEANAKLS